MPLKKHLYKASFWQGFLLTLALILIVTGARFLTIQKWAFDLPYWDQWEGELAHVILPYLNGTLTWESFFIPHNEHRIAWSRLIFLGLFVENGQWDNVLEATVNVFIQCLVAVVLFLTGRRLFQTPGIYLWWLVIVMIFSLPFGYENTLVGFQSQFYLMTLFTVLIMWIGSRENMKLAVKLPCLLITCFILLFTLGSGFLGPLALVLAMMLIALIKKEFFKVIRKEIWVLLALAATIVAGVILLPHVDYHNHLKAQGAGQFIAATGRYFSWPWSVITSAALAQFGLALLLWLPCLLYLGCLWMNKDKIKADDVFIFALIGWGALQALGMSYSRGGGDLQFVAPASRYADTLVLSLISNFLALWRVAMITASFRCWGRASSVFSMIWISVVALGLTLLTMYNLQVELPLRTRDFTKQNENIVNFLNDNDPRHLLNKPLLEVPYHTPQRLITLLRIPGVAEIMPLSVRAPLKITDTNVEESTGFIADGYPTALEPPLHKVIGSYSTESGAENKGVYYGEFTSPNKLPYLAFNLAGHIQEQGSTFEIKAGSKKRLKLTAPERSAVQWTLAYQKSQGPGVYEIRASDKSITRWLAFSEPKEIGRLSKYARQLLDNSSYFLLSGMSLFLVLIISRVWLLSHTPETE